MAEFAVCTPDLHDIGGGRPIKGEMRFAALDQPVFAIAEFEHRIGDVKHFAIVTGEPNELVAPIHPESDDLGARGSRKAAVG